MVIKYSILIIFITISLCKPKLNNVSVEKKENIMLAKNTTSKKIIVKDASKLDIDTLNFKIPEEIKTPLFLINLFKEVEKTLAIDFNGDSKADYLCYTKKKTTNGYTLVENWVDSSLKIVRQKENYFEYDYKWFIDLDNDKIPEIIKAQGESEGIDYGVYKLNFSEINDNILFYFNPVIEYENKFYWGYPWEIKDIILNNTLIKCSLDNNILRDGEITKPEWQKKIPAIIFKGKNEDEVNSLKGVRVSQIENLKNFQFEKIENLKNLVL